jgi:hypothetical protein
VKNQNGLISALSNSGSGTSSQDLYTTYFSSSSPPVVTNVIASNTDVPSNPVVSSEYTVSAGGNVYIKWKATDAVGLGSNPITVEYSTDGSTYTQIATGLSNGANSSCTIDSSSTTLDDGNTGCYVWSGTSIGTYFVVRIRATNLGSTTASAQSAPVNAGNINVIAGNLDKGVNGSAQSAIINMINAGSSPRVQQFVVMPDGKIILIDQTTGIMIIDPVDGKYKVLIANGASNSNQGDGGDVALAKVKTPSKIILGYDNNLYLWDDYRIRKITTSTTPWTINTIIGGGGTVNGSSVAGTSFSLSSPAAFNTAFTARPDGTIWFVPNNFGSAFNSAVPPALYSYSLSSGVATRIGAFSGVGHSASSSDDLVSLGLYFYNGQVGASFNPVDSTTISVLGAISVNANGRSGRFNPTTLVASQSDLSAYPYFGGSTGISSNSNLYVGMDGKIYSLNSGTGTISRWNDSSSTGTTILGTGALGVCSDGIAALSCKANPADVFVNSSGKFYWYENGMIRTLDSSGNVLTVAGQNTFYGDTLAAINARFGVIPSIAVKSNGNVVVFDRTNIRIRELDKSTGQMKLLAGNNQNATANTTSLANAQPISRDIWVTTDLINVLPSTDEVIYSRGNSIAKISSSTGKWVDIAGNGTTDYTTADGLGLGSVKMNSAYFPKIVGVIGSSVLTALGSWNSAGSSTKDGMLKTYDISNGVQSAFAGITGNATGNWPSDGSTLATTLFPHSNYAYTFNYDSVNSNWITFPGNNTVKTVTQGGAIANLFTDSGTSAIKALTISRASGHLIVYYCAIVGSNNQLKKWDQSTATITTLSWPSTSLSCQTTGLVYDSSSDKLIFTIYSNGLYGIAEYANP